MKINFDITKQQIANLLCGAFEGGSNYWYMIESEHAPIRLFRSSSNQIFPHIDYPLGEGGYLMISSLEKDKIKGKTSWKLDLHSITKGMRIFANKYPTHFADFLKEDDDAITADVFLQCCLFGEIIYG